MNIQQLIRENIRQLKPYSSARDEFTGVADIYLDANENPFESEVNRYPDPYQRELKNKVAALKKVPVENIFLGNGSDEAIDLLIRIFCEPKEDEIIILPPTYGMYAVSAAIANVNIKEISLTNNLQPNTKSILATANANTKLLFLCSPNNPTGNNFDPKIIRTLIENFTGIVVVDEAYIDFSTQESCTQWLQEYPNLVVLQTFSKAWGLAGIRLGMAFASTEIITLFNKVKPPYNINQLTQNAAHQALDDTASFQSKLDYLIQQRSWLKNALSQLHEVEKIYPSNTNFLLVKIKDCNTLFEHLTQQKIIVRNRSKVHLCEGCLRFTVGTAEENKRLIKEIQLFFS